MKYILPSLMLLLFAASCQKNNGGSPKPVNGDVVYVESNDYRDNQNKIIAYLNKGDGKLEELPGSPFPAGGSGVGDPTQALGPLDSDNQLKISSDGHFLLAVNAGSNTIAVFNILDDGSLISVSGSPFSSDGQTPVSIGTKDNYIYVVNKAQDSVHKITTKPNYTVFTIDYKGTLTPVPHSTIELSTGASPAQALVSNDGKFLFGADFLAFMLQPAQGTLRSFTIDSNGKLDAVAGTPQAIPMGGALGLAQNPRDNTLYVGSPVTGQVDVYGVDGSSGALNFVNSVTSGPASCWLRTAHDGSNLYALNSAENSISVFNSSSTKSLSLMNKVFLKESGPLFTAGGKQNSTSEDFSFEFSPTQNFVYVVSQFANPDFSVGNFNYLHVLEVAADGNLTETKDPTLLPVANIFRPQGVEVVHFSNLSK